MSQQLCKTCGQIKTSFHYRKATCTDCPNPAKITNKVSKPHYIYVARCLSTDTAVQAIPVYKIGKSVDSKTILEERLKKYGPMEIVIYQEFLNEETVNYANNILREDLIEYAVTVQNRVTGNFKASKTYQVSPTEIYQTMHKILAAIEARFE